MKKKEFMSFETCGLKILKNVTCVYAYVGVILVQVYYKFIG